MVLDARELVNEGKALIEHWGDGEAQKALQTLGRAMALAGASILEVHSREIGVFGITLGNKSARLGLVLYDPVPGGAGHLAQLAKVMPAWLAKARDKLRGTTDHDRTCEVACLDCILTFDASFEVAADELHRRDTLDWLDLAWPDSTANEVVTGGCSPRELLAIALEEGVPADVGADEHWRSVREACIAALLGREGLADEDRRRLAWARDIVRRHLGEQAPLPWPDDVIMDKGKYHKCSNGCKANQLNELRRGCSG